MRSIHFLEVFHPDRAWIITAIKPNQKNIETRAFMPDQVEEAAAWVEERSGEWNLYFSVNEVLNPENKKASKENIRQVWYLHLDIDAKPGKDLVDELTRIKALSTDELPPGVPKPTVVVYSGGGYQLFWRLKEPIPIMGGAEAAAHAERYNRQLELIFKADNCHNVDRIMRLPGTLNIPGARKLANGRVPVTADVVYFDDTSYSIAEFTQAPDVALPGSSDLDIGGNVVRLGTVEDLAQWSVPDRVRMVIVQGMDPDEPKEKDNSRSAWLFDVVCNLIRCEVPDEVVYSVITDPGFKISESVLEHNDPHRYALKQIKSGKEAVESERLYQLNQKHAVIGNLGGKCRVIEEVYDEAMGRHRLVKQSFEDFRNRYMNQFETVTEKNSRGEVMTKAVPVGKFWLAHPRRRQYDRLVFAPGQGVEDAYNLWRGFGCNALEGDRHRGFLDHIRDVICSGNPQHYEYTLRWMARAVQQPGEAGYSCVVLRGKPGTGKSFFAKHFGKLFGRHFLHVSSPGHLTGNFNSHLRDAVLVFGDEVFHAGDKAHEARLKTLVTEDSFMVEAKGVDAEASPNFVHLILASNEEWVVPVGSQDRRFFIMDVSDKWALNDGASLDEHEARAKHFGGLQADLEMGGYESLLWYLQNYDLTGFNVGAIPFTVAKAEQRVLSCPVERLIKETFDSGAVKWMTEEVGGDRCFRSAAVSDHLAEVKGVEISSLKIGRILAKLGMEKKTVRGSALWILDRSLPEMRKRCTLKVAWDEDVQCWTWEGSTF